MDDTLTEEEIQPAVQRIFKLVQTDVKFRALCLSDPAEAIREITGKSLPPGFEIRFLDCGADGATTPADSATDVTSLPCTPSE